jgi:hypothetical protein
MEIHQVDHIRFKWLNYAHDSPHNYAASLHEAQSSREQRLLIEQSGKRQHQRL